MTSYSGKYYDYVISVEQALRVMTEHWLAIIDNPPTDQEFTEAMSKQLISGAIKLMPKEFIEEFKQEVKSKILEIREDGRKTES